MVLIPSKVIVFKLTQFVNIEAISFKMQLDKLISMILLKSENNPVALIDSSLYFNKSVLSSSTNVTTFEFSTNKFRTPELSNKYISLGL